MNCAALTVMAELVLAVLVPSLRSALVTVKVPLVLKATAKLCVPLANAALAGKVAVESLEVIPTLSVIVFTRFQFVSTALTVTLKPVKADCALGVPLLPEVLPGAAVSPGASTCNFTNAPAFTVTLPLVFAVNVPAASVAVIVRVPAPLKVKLDKVFVPATNVMFPAAAPLSSAILALLSELLIMTLGVAVLMTFQLASTALTTMPFAIALAAV